MRWAQVMTISFGLALACLTACGGADDGEDKQAAVTAPTNLKATTVGGKAHLTWTDAMNEDSYRIERMDHSEGTDWVVLEDAKELVPNTVQYHDTTADMSKSYMYRVTAIQGDQSKVSNEVSWP